VKQGLGAISFSRDIPYLITIIVIIIIIIIIDVPGQRSRYGDYLRAGGSGDRSPVGGKIFRKRPDQPCGPPSFLYSWYGISFPRVKRPGHGVTHLYLALWLRKE